MITREVRVEWYASGADVGDGEGIGPATLRYDPADPLAVHIGFDDDNEWAVDREMLLAGLNGPVGGGDIRIVPYKTRIAVVLFSPFGHGLVLFPRRPVEEFIQQVRDIKDDTPDIDGLIEKILAEDWL